DADADPGSNRPANQDTQQHQPDEHGKQAPDQHPREPDSPDPERPKGQEPESVSARRDPEDNNSHSNAAAADTTTPHTKTNDTPDPTGNHKDTPDTDTTHNSDTDTNNDHAKDGAADKDGQHEADNDRHGESTSDADSADAKDSPDAGDGKQHYDPDQDAFNQEHRPDIKHNVTVGADSPLAPKTTKPFGDGVDLQPNTCYDVAERGKFYTNEQGEIVHVETESAALRQTWWDHDGVSPMNPDLKDPLPNATYTVDGKFHYTTDPWGRTVRIQVDRMDVVDQSLRYRSESVQQRIGHYGDGIAKDTYDGGHMVGSQSGGGPEDLNEVPMHKDVNRGTNGTYPKSYRRFEYEVAANPDNYRNIDIRIEYDGPPANADSVNRLSDVNPVDRVPTRWEVHSQDANGISRVPRRFENR
ncbi:MAG: DNA/RNA non-specific endonuclease, partial [Actinomyces succiniciruminis]|nr:DNA/RNA non-specific endonuclease [Actinomyces succiniciruminis]